MSFDSSRQAECNKILKAVAQLCDKLLAKMSFDLQAIGCPHQQVK